MNIDLSKGRFKKKSVYFKYPLRKCLIKNSQLSYYHLEYVHAIQKL